MCEGGVWQAALCEQANPNANASYNQPVEMKKSNQSKWKNPSIETMIQKIRQSEGNKLTENHSKPTWALLVRENVGVSHRKKHDGNDDFGREQT